MLRGGEPMPESTECGFVLPLLFIMPLAPAVAVPLEVRRPTLLLLLLLLTPLLAPVEGTEKVLEPDDDDDEDGD